MRSFRVGVLAAVLFVAAGSAAQADNVKGADLLLCTAVQATGCYESGECEIDLPWNLNVPQFIQVDLKGKRLATTKASGENRSTPLDQVRHEGGAIVLQGFEKGRAFSFVIMEETGFATVAVATDGKAVVVFGACTTLDPAR